MNRLTSMVLALILGCTLAAAQKPAKKSSAPAKSPPTLQDLVLQGKTADAVRLATKTPASVSPFVKQLIEQVDLQITDRKIVEAQASLAATDKFLDAYVAAAKATDLPRDAVKGRILRIQGIQLSDEKQYAKAEDVLRKALDLSRRAADRTLEAGIRNNLGYSLRYQDKPGEADKLEQAAKEFDTARQIAEDQKDALRAGSYNFNLGEALLQLRRNEAAQQAFKRSAEQNAAASKTSLVARATLMQGVAVSRVNIAGDEALAYFSKAQKMFESLGDTRNAGWSYWLMADHTAYMGKFTDAIGWAEHAVPLLKTAGDKAGVARCYEFLADMYARPPGDKAKVEQYKKLAEETAKNP
jgi:tetratricopeptide (TPR) repeat protein